ncbi:MAG: HEPN domain-containing protein [bacterium]
MPRKHMGLGTPGDWLNRARSNLIRARQPKMEGVFWEDLCFDAQQATEKALKAVLIDRGIQFRLVHDIAELLTYLEKNGLSLPEEICAAAALTNFAVEARYPGTAEPVTSEEFKEVLQTAEAVVTWAEALVKNKKV